MKALTISEKRGEFEVFARTEPMGSDLLVTLWGGVAHIGAVGMAEPRPSLKDAAIRSATSSVFTFPGHKEDDVAKSMAESLAARLDAKVVVVAGIHWDNLRPEQIRSIIAACDSLRERLIGELSGLS